MIKSITHLLMLTDLFYKFASKKKEIGTIYLIHFSESIGSENIRGRAAHYIGWTSDLASRLTAHSLGQGSAILRYLVQNNIPFEVVKTWKGTRDQERYLKNQKNSKRYCPLCSQPTYTYLNDER